MSFSCQKGEFDRFFNRLDRPVEESRPDRQPDRPVDPIGFHLCSGGNLRGFPRKLNFIRVCALYKRVHFIVL